MEGSVTSVLLPLKYEIDNSVTARGGALLYAYGRDIGLQIRQKPTIARSKFTEFLLIHYTSAFLVVLFDEYSRNIFHYYTLPCILSRYVRLHAPIASP